MTSKRVQRVLYYGGGWPTNIGNAFIDMGALALLRRALPDCEIAFASEMPRWFFSHQPKALRFGRRRERGQLVDNALDIAAVAACDLIVYGGMAMCKRFVEINGPTILSCVRRGIRVLLLGTGAEEYTAVEQAEVGAFLTEIAPIGVITRDESSHDMFARYAANSTVGIDCGFFVSEAFRPFPVDLGPYVVWTFDTSPEPAEEGAPDSAGVVRAHHECWGPIHERRKTHARTLVSDLPHDYLTLYAGAQEVHSDRVHACVAALAFGRKARLYHATPRGALFHAVGAEAVRERVTELDMDRLAVLKEKQVEWVRQTVTSA